MPAEKWNESGRLWEEDHGLLDEEQARIEELATNARWNSGRAAGNERTLQALL
jgi:hypothetical protein